MTDSFTCALSSSSILSKKENNAEPFSFIFIDGVACVKRIWTISHRFSLSFVLSFSEAQEEGQGILDVGLASRQTNIERRKSLPVSEWMKESEEETVD